MKIYILIVSRQFMKSHPRVGEKTEFVCKILHAINHPGGSDLYIRCGNECGVSCARRLKEPKIHTIRVNYDFWKKRIDEVTAGMAVLSVRYWSGKPYNSKQITVVDLTKKDGVTIQLLTWHGGEAWSRNDNLPHWISIEELSKNDGLSVEDFKNWFKGYDLNERMAIIHFTEFRY